MRLEIGKLYRCADYCLILYPDYESIVTPPNFWARSAWPAVGLNSQMASLMCQDLSRALKKPVTFCKENSPVLTLRQQAISYFEVLAGDRRGWFIFRKNWMSLKEIV